MLYPRRHFRSTGSGFSLIELVLVLAIAGVLFAIAAPRYGQSVDRYRAEIAARRIAADLLLAKTRARTASHSQSISFNSATGTYTLPGESDADHPSETYSVNLTKAPYRASLAAVSFGGTAVLTFNGYGVPNFAGSITVRAGSSQRTVAVAATSGEITVQ
jgi:prepilin-type N-terminal cleavage/methylation domain-containing protein